MAKLWHDIFKYKSNKKYSTLGAKPQKKLIKQLTTNLDILQRRLTEARNVGIKKLILVDADRDHIKKFQIVFQQSPSDNIEEYILYKKDKNRISDKLFCSIKADFKFNVSLRTIKILRKKLNNEVVFFEVNENNVHGFYLDPKDAIEKKIRYLLKKGINIENNIIKIKLSADGMNVCRNLKVINMIFTVINEGEESAGVNGAYQIGIFQIQIENYNSISIWMSKIWEKCQEFKELIIDDAKFSIIYYFGSDYKMDSIVLGLFGAASNYPCIYCKSHASELHSPPDKSLYRSNADHLNIITGPKSREHYGYKEISLISNIPYDNVVIDLLHLILRFTDRIFHLLIADLCSIDNYEKSILDRKKHINLCKFSDFLLNDCQININFDYETKKDIFDCLNNLPVKKRLEVFRKINIHELFGESFDKDEVAMRIDDYLEFAENDPKDQNGNLINKDGDLIDKATIKKVGRSIIINKVWKDWLSIIDLLKKGGKPLKGRKTITATQGEIKLSETEPEHSVIKIRNEKWLKTFLKVYQTSKVTPYMHIFVYHLPKLYELHGNIDFFNVNGLEKLNDFTRMDYFRSTNKTQESLKQIFFKRCRIDYLKEKFE
jgi:hypothetical protein